MQSWLKCNIDKWLFTMAYGDLDRLNNDTRLEY